VLFLLRGCLYLVAVSSREEAPAALRRQLELLHQAIVMTVTGGELITCVQLNPAVRRLLQLCSMRWWTLWGVWVVVVLC
jgi:hypothetical protein